jgi:hypothetical protein
VVTGNVGAEHLSEHYLDAQQLPEKGTMTCAVQLTVLTCMLLVQESPPDNDSYVMRVVRVFPCVNLSARVSGPLRCVALQGTRSPKKTKWWFHDDGC